MRTIQAKLTVLEISLWEKITLFQLRLNEKENLNLMTHVPRSTEVNQNLVEKFKQIHEGKGGPFAFLSSLLGRII